MPLTVWALFLTAILGVLAFPVLVAGVVLLIFDRSFGTSFLSFWYHIERKSTTLWGRQPDIVFSIYSGFLGHPEVYIVIMPAMGIYVRSYSRKFTQNQSSVTMQWVLLPDFPLQCFRFIVWGHHMFVTGMNPFLGGVFMITTLIIAVPSAVKTFNWLATLWRGNIRFNPGYGFLLSEWYPSSFQVG